MRRHYCLLLLLCIAVSAQPDQSSGIEGFVTSDLATVIPNATVGVDNLTKGFHRETVTNTSGYYVIEQLNPGAYSISAEVKGVGCIIYPHVAVFPGQRVRQDFRFVRANRSPGGCEPLQKKSSKLSNPPGVHFETRCRKREIAHERGEKRKY